MMRKYRGIVCEKKASYTVFLTENGEFLRGVPLIADVQIGEEAAFHLIASTTSKRRMKPIFIAPALIAAILLLFLVASWFPKATPAYAYLQVEGDSTLEIGVDDEGNVISLRSLDKKQVEIDEWEGLPVEIVIAKAIEEVGNTTHKIEMKTVYKKKEQIELNKRIEKAIKEPLKTKKQKPVEIKIKTKEPSDTPPKTNNNKSNENSDIPIQNQQPEKVDPNATKTQPDNKYKEKSKANKDNNGNEKPIQKEKDKKPNNPNSNKSSSNNYEKSEDKQTPNSNSNSNSNNPNDNSQKVKNNSNKTNNNSTNKP